MQRHGAVAVIVSGDKILLFHRDDIPTIPLPDTWQLPGGQIEDGETPLDAVRRELSEEVTYVPHELHYVGYFDNISEHNHVFITFVSIEEETKFKHGPGEGQEIRFFTLDEAREIKLTPPLRWFLENKREDIEDVMSNKKIPDAEALGMKKVN